MYYSIVDEGAAKNLTPGSRAGLKPQRGGKSVSLCSRLLKPAKPILGASPIMGYSQNLKTIRLLSVNDGQRESAKGSASDIWRQLDLPRFR